MPKGNSTHISELKLVRDISRFLEEGMSQLSVAPNKNHFHILINTLSDFPNWVLSKFTVGYGAKRTFFLFQYKHIS